MNQKILVTAGAAGIGLEIVKAFAATGAKKIICDINEVALKELEQNVPGVITKVCDVSKRSDIESMVKFGAEALGGLDVLVNNAGISGPTAPVVPGVTMYCGEEQKPITPLSKRKGTMPWPYNR